MTNQHPLTDEIMHELHGPTTGRSGPRPYGSDDMRRAADWQLEQVIEWLKSNLRSHLYLEAVGHSGGVAVDVDYVIEDLRKAMRPTTTQEDNQ